MELSEQFFRECEAAYPDGVYPTLDDYGRALQAIRELESFYGYDQSGRIDYGGVLTAQKMIVHNTYTGRGKIYIPGYEGWWSL